MAFEFALSAVRIAVDPCAVRCVSAPLKGPHNKGYSWLAEVYEALEFGGRHGKRYRRCQLCPASVVATRAMVTASMGRLR